jgi:hypothetical protein
MSLEAWILAEQIILSMVALVALVAVAAICLQADADTAHHRAVARLIRRGGFHRDCPCNPK